MLPDFLVEHYTLSSDGKRIVFVAVDTSRHLPVWVAALDGSYPPVKISSIDAVRAFFGAKNEVFFMGVHFGPIMRDERNVHQPVRIRIGQ